jgi:hypothetical protein
VLSGPPKNGAVRAGRGDPNGAYDSAIEIEMSRTGGRGLPRRRRQIRCFSGQDVDAFMQVVMAGLWLMALSVASRRTRAP